MLLIDIGNRQPQTHFGHGAGFISGTVTNVSVYQCVQYYYYIKFITYKLSEHECCLKSHDNEYVGLLVFILLTD